MASHNTVALLLLTACSTEKAPNKRHKEPVELVYPTLPSTSVIETAVHTSDTAVTTTSTVYDCEELPSGPTSNWKMDILTEEDFDFDATGFLMRQEWGNIAGINFAREERIYSANSGSDVAGIRMLADGGMAYADHSTSAIWIVAPNGAKEKAVTNIVQPNGLALRSDGVLFYTSFYGSGYLAWYNPNTDQKGRLADLNTPNGIEFSPDEKTIYVSAYYDNIGRILALDEQPDGTWGTPRIVLTAPAGSSFDTVTTDVCGNIYTVDYKFSGNLANVYRISADETQSDVIFQIPSNFPAMNSMRWGNGIGGWERNHLFFTNRQEMYVLEMPIEGHWSPFIP